MYLAIRQGAERNIASSSELAEALREFTLDLVSFSERLREARTTAGLSQNALARAAGMTRQGVYELERYGDRQPRSETVTRIAEALGVSPNWLLLGDEGDVADALQAFLDSDAGIHVTEEERRFLEGIPWPESVTPNPHAYSALLSVLRMQERR